MDLDGMLKELGQFGRFQALYLFLLLFPVTLWGFRATEYIFTTMDIPHRCRIPECEGLSGTPDETPPWLKDAVPFTADHTPDPCLRYAPRHDYTLGQGNLTSCPAEIFNNGTSESCRDWVFAQPTKTIIHDFDIMCPSEYWKRTLLSSLSVITNFVGLPLAGLLSDRYGRKTVLVAGSSILSVSGILRSLTPNYASLAALEMFDGLATGTIFGPAFLLGLETLSPSKRLLGSMLINIYFAVGEIVLVAIMWVVQDWRVLLRVFYIPMLSLVALHWLLPESIRWLHTQGKYEEMNHVFRRISKLNHTEDRLTSIIDHLQPVEDNETPLNKSKDEKHQESNSEPIRTLRFSAVLKSKIIMCRLLICAFCWVATIFTYYGISQSATKLSNNFYLSFLCVSLAELPGYVVSLWLPDWPLLGRRGSLAGAFFVGGVASFAEVFLSHDQVLLSLILYLVAKFCSTLTITVVYLYTAEIFPTELRHTLLSTCSMLGRLGAILSQQVPLISVYVPPMLVFGLMSLVGGVATLMGPETLNTKLPDTIQEAEQLGRAPRTARG